MHINIVYNIVLFVNTLFWYNTFFTYAIKNILLISVVMFSLFLAPDEQPKGFKYLVALWSVIREDHLCSQRQGCYVGWTANVTHLTPDSKT